MIDFKETLGCGKCFWPIMLSVASRGLFIAIAEPKFKDSKKSLKKKLSGKIVHYFHNKSLTCLDIAIRMQRQTAACGNLKAITLDLDFIQHT